LYQNYVQSQQPPRQPELTPEERAAKPIHRMDYSDVLEMAKTSKYFKDGTWNDDMQRAYNEVRARRSRGE
jgi:aspartyl/asparaginyl-tRNA synthetase